MKLEYIRSFISVVNYKSFSVAAQNTFLSQPTISTHIKQLESELGVQLLVRSTKDVILSEEGLAFYPFAVQLLETQKEALTLLSNKGADTGGCVSFSTSSVPGNYMLPGFLAFARGVYPDISYRVSEGDSANVIREILHFETELGIGSIKSNNEKCICEPLFEDEIVLVTPNVERFRRLRGKCTPELLKKEPYVLREVGSGTKAAAENMEHSLNINMNTIQVAAQFESSEMVRKAVEAGVGIAFISKMAIEESLSQKKILEFSFPGVNTKRVLYLIYHKDRVLSPAVRAVIGALRKYCKELIS